MKLYRGDCLEVMKTMESNSVDSVVTDPPYGWSFMGKKWDYDVPSVELWKEVLRVLKPGGHALVACGTRTQHRMAVNLEDAGFEIRDVIIWCYGQGFPKSLNVGKAIDKINGESGRLLKFTNWMRTTGIKSSEIDKITNTNMGGHYLTTASQPAIPTAEIWKTLRPHIKIKIPQWVDELVERIEAEREVIGQQYNIANKSNDNTGRYNWNTEGQERKESIDITAPATEQAKQWQGWGTALKPSVEIWTLCRKRIEGTIAENVLKWGTGGINIDATRIPAYINGDNNENIVLSHKLSELRGKLYTLLFSFVVDKRDCPTPANVSEYVQNWKLLQDYLGDCSIYRGLYDELSPLFQEDDQVSFRLLHDVHGGISRLRQAQNDNLLSQGIDHLSSLDDFDQLIYSYLNDTTLYIKKQENLGRKNNKPPYGSERTWSVSKTPPQDNTDNPPQGRFPANLLHDGSDEVVGLFPNTTHAGNKKPSPASEGIFGIGRQDFRNTYGNDGNSAARFFYCAKASKSERNKGLEGVTNGHPTVKPVKLMQYLCRLITPKGGTVLDPFMGSGTTGVACKRLNRDFIGIELDNEYFEIAKARIKDTNL